MRINCLDTANIHLCQIRVCGTPSRGVLELCWRRHYVSDVTIPGPEVNKFEKVSSDDHQVSLARGPVQ